MVRRYTNNNKISEVQVREILLRAMMEEATYPELADEYEISVRQVGKIVRRQAWHHVEAPEGYDKFLRNRLKVTEFVHHPWRGTKDTLALSRRQP